MDFSKIFEKKVIIGSLLGIVATTLGVIAVFFPNLFNLESKKIKDNEKLELVVKTYVGEKSDAKKLYEFLYENAAEDNNPKNSRIVYMNVTICNSNIDSEEYFSKPHPDEPLYLISGGTSNQPGPIDIRKFNSDSDGFFLAADEAYEYNFSDGVTYLFNWRDLTECDNITDGWKIEGYFMSPVPHGTYQGTATFSLEAIPEKDILLKKYK